MKSKNIRSTFLYAALAVLAAGMLYGCGGGGDSAGPAAGTGAALTPAPVPPGNAPVDASALTADQFAALAPQVTIGGALVASPPQVSFALADANNNGIKNFFSKSQSATATVASYPNLALSLAKLVPGTNGSPSKWVSYIVTTVPTKNATTGAITDATATRPSTDNTGTLVDNGNGTYTYTFYRDVTKIKDQVAGMTVSGANNLADLGDLTWEPNLVHRLTIQIAGNVPGTGTNTSNGVQVTTGVPMTNPVNVIYDFIPAKGQTAVSPTDTSVTQRLVVDKLSCNECHAKLGGIPGTESASFHNGSRYDPKYCVVCHTDQRKYGQKNITSTNNAFPPITKDANGNVTSPSTFVADGVTVGDFPVLIHRVHKGEELIKQNYNFGGVLLNETKFPQDIRNCTKCHDDTSPKVAPQASNFQTTPSRLACGACHDGIDFSTGKGTNNSSNWQTGVNNTWGHIGGAQADDSKCTFCHDATSIKTVYHVAVTPPNANNCLSVAAPVGACTTNAAWIASNPDNLPAGAIKVAYDIQSVSLNANKNPVIVFRLLQNGTAKPFNDPASKSEIWDGFFGAPSVYFVWAVPQDGVTAPADFNANASGWLKTLWKAGGAGFKGPDANGYYTATLTTVTVPANAVMFSGGLGYTYSLGSTPPLTQTGVSDPIQSNTTFGQTRYGVTTSTIVGGTENKIGGLIVVAPDKQTVGAGFTGRRTIVDDTKCNACHKELGMFTAEAFHAGQRNDATTCAWCHRPNQTSSAWSADSAYYIHAIHASDFRNKPFTWHASKVGESFADVKYPGILNKCETCHVSTGYDFGNLDQTTIDSRLYRTVGVGKYNAAASALAAFSISPYVVADNVTNYGTGPSYSAATGTITTDATTANNLVISPIATACFACHDSDTDKQHMESNGGSVYAPRSTALAKKEQCLFCHKADSSFGLGIKEVHSK